MKLMSELEVRFRSFVLERICRSAALVVLFAAGAGLASAQVTLSAHASPSEAPPVLTTVSVDGTGFPSGTIVPGSVSVTITPPSGNGSPVSTAATGVFPATGGASRTIQFTIPVALTAAAALPGCQVTVSGTTTGLTSFTTSNYALLQVDPPASILSASPGAGTRGSTVTLSIVGSYTHFTTSTPVVTLNGPGNTVLSPTAGSVSVTDAQHLSAQFVIPADATTGSYRVQTVVGTEIANLANGFLVSPNAGLSLTSISPNTLAAGACTSVAIVGNGTSWQSGVTVATFGDGIKINGAGTAFASVTDATHASLPICIDPIAVPGTRSLTIATGGEFESAANAFTITPNGSTLQSVTPGTGPQGTNQTLAFTGVGTHWLQGATTVGFGSGINVGNIIVNGPTSLTVNISISPSAAVTSYAATVATNGEIVSLPGALSVTQATPYLANVSPASGDPGQTLNITFTGVSTHFQTGPFTLNLGPDITVNGTITPASDTSATASVTISSTAFTGGRRGFISTNGSIYNFAFTVNGSNTFITSVTPSSGYQGASVALQVSGLGTHWAQGLTNAAMGDLVINRVVVNSATSAEVDITIPQLAYTGTHGLTMSTNGEIETDANAFAVLPYTPSVTISPASGMIGTTVNVNFTGNFTHWAPSSSTNPTVLDIDGEGVTIQNFNVTGPHSATAQFVIDANAPTAPAVPCVNIYGGNRTITVETPLNDVSEIVNTGFCVTSTPAVLTSITPYESGEPATNLHVAITGQYTHFVQGTTTVGFGPEISVVPGSVIVTDSTHVSAIVNIPASVPIGWLPVFVNTGDEQLTIGFSIVPPASASLVSVAPNSGLQGQSLTVNITGNLTSFDQATSQAILGSGITVNSLTVNSPDSATAQISISPTTYVGGRTVTMISGANESEVVSGPLFSVQQGVATISQVGCGATPQTAETNLAPVNCNVSNNGIPQGAIVSFAVQGSSTNWLQGETTLDFGQGITVASLNVVSPTLAYCQITVSYSANLGFRKVTATTNGQVAPSFNDAINIVPSSGLSLNITPTSSAQGTTFTMQVNGTATHFTANNTVASFGNNNGINVTAVNVISPTQMNLTVQVLGTAYLPGPYTLTVTTTGLPVPPNVTSTEQLTLPNVFSVTAGAGIITAVTPTTGKQGSTAQLQITGQNTSFQTGVTTAYLSTGGCNPPNPAGVNVSNVTASSNTSATVSVAISPTAPTGFQTLCMYTLGESVSYANAFTVTPGTATLNSVTTPTSGSSGQQGEVISSNVSGPISLTGQYTHWTQGTTTATFGQGITLTSLTVTSPTTATANIAIDPIAYTGSRKVTVTTGSEIVSGNLFNVTTGPAIVSTISPSSANQGQHILMTINGQFTHWSQTLTQFSISGGGYDIAVNGVVINSPTQALADLTVSGTANLGTRTIFMSTEGENVALNAGLLITGGIPSVSSVSPSSGTVGDTGDNIIISGAFTHWDSSTVVDFGDPNITVTALSNNSSTSETAVITIGSNATVGLHTVTVRTGGQALLGQFNVLSKALPPTPYISYIYPGVALVGQTLQVNLNGAYTKWNPSTTTATFGAGIQVNSFQVLGLNSATANITIEDGAGVGYRTVSLTTGAEVENTSFFVTVGTPVISLVDPGSAIQGDTRDIDLVGQYTTWSDSTTFSFCSGIVINSATVFGPNAARVNVTVPILQSLGGCGVTATTGTEVAHNISSFSVTPSTATILSVTPNTAIQGTQNFSVDVTGLATHWVAGTNFSFGSGSVSVASINVIDETHATLTLDLAPLASPGLYTLTATTGGEVARLDNAFVVQPGTPILLSSTPGSAQQQGSFSLGILGQYTSFVNGTTTVAITSQGVNIAGVSVTGPQSITVTGTVNPIAYTGCSNIIVTTGSQVLTLYGAFCITLGPAAITQLTPSTGPTSTSLDVGITGTNTNWIQGTTIGTFGPGISLNTLTINSATSATANITIAANATPEANTVTLTTAGEVASDPSSFTITQSTPIVDIVTPGTAAQGQSASVSVVSSFSNFVNGNTTADFGTGITVNSVSVTDLTHATVNITVTPIAATGARTVRMITNLSGGAQEIAIKANSFTVTAGSAAISSIVPTAPVSVHQNDSGDILTVTGSGTHFTEATLTNASVVFCSGVTTAAVQVVDDLHLQATVNIGTFAPTGVCGVTVTSGGEVATGGSFTILGGIPVITQVNPNSAHQGDNNVSINITGLYTNFTSGALNVAIPGGTFVGTPTANSNTSLTAVFNFSNTAATGAQNVTVSDTTDGTIAPDVNAFTVNTGVPTFVSISPNVQGQGVTNTFTITGNFTHFSTSSVVAVSGTGVTVGAIVGGTLTPTSLQVPFTVANLSPAGARTVTVTTGTEVVSLNANAAGAYTVLAGIPNITQISPNIGVPNSTVPVTVTGIYTNWANGTTVASFGPGISVNGAAAGTAGTVNVTGPTTFTAVLTIDAGATIQAQNVVVTTGAQILTATDGFQVLTSTTTAPVVTYISPADNSTGVPINTNVTVQFSEPLDPATVPSNGANAFLTDSTLGFGCWGTSGLAANVSLDVSGRIMTIVPSAPLALGHTFNVQLNSYGVPVGTPTIQDQSGNALGRYCYRFTSGLTAVNNGPAFVSANIPAGATNVPTNTHNVILGFDQPIDPATQAAALSITSGAAIPVPGTWSYNTAFTQAIFTPAASWAASTTFTVSFSAQLQNTSGLALTNPGSFTFTTGTVTDTGSGSYVTWTPPYRGGTLVTGTNPAIRFIYSKPINPLTVTPANFYVYDTDNGVTVLGSTVSWSADFKTFTLTLAQPLAASTNYRWVLQSALDWVGNSVPTGSVYFTTSTGTDTTAPTVTSVSPSSTISCGGNPCAPVSSEIDIQFSELMDPTTLAAGAVTLTPTAPAGPAVTGTFSFSPDFACTSPSSTNTCNFAELKFKPSTPLAANTTYEIAIPDGQLADLSGNFDPFTSSFTTGSSSTPDTTRGTVTSITPSSGATNVALNTNVVVQFDKAVDPLTINANSIYVFDNTAPNSPLVPGTLTVSANQQTVTFTQTLPFVPGHRFCIYVSYNASVFDLSGNAFNYVTQCFTAGAGTDTVAPTVVSVTPLNNATAIGPNNPVMVTFSKSMNPGTLSNNLAIYNGPTLYTTNYSVSNDNTTVIFSSGNLSFSTTFTVVVNPDVTDLAGNPLGTEFSSTFTTGPAPVTGSPQVTAMRPASGATGVNAANPITFFVSSPLNPATVTASTLVVTQNGVAVTGSINVAADNQDVTFTPATAFAGGAIINVFFTSGAKDSYGNSLVNFQSAFTIAPDLTSAAPTVLSYQPSRYCNNCLDPNGSFEILFSKPMNIATLTSANLYVSTSSSGTPLVPANVTLLDGGRLVRLKPVSTLATSTYYYVFAKTAIQDTTGLSFAGGSDSYLYYAGTTGSSDAAAPTVTASAPTNGSTAIGTNAVVSVNFSENVDQLTLDPSNVTLTGPGGSIPISIGYSSSNGINVMSVTPQSPLPPNANVSLTINNVSDLAGNALNPSPFNDLTFTTGPGPDYNPPVVVSTNIQDGAVNVPVTTGFSLVFDKPIDFRSVILDSTIYLQDQTAGYSNLAATVASTSAKSLVVTPASPLPVNHVYRVYERSIADLNGNVSAQAIFSFTTVLTASPGGPVVTQMIPVNGTTAPVNFSPMVKFDRAVSPQSLAGVTLMQGGNPVASTAQLSSGGTVLTLAPAAILKPGTSYTFTVAGVQDSAGNTMTGSVSRAFTTGTGIDLTNPVITVASPIYGGTSGTNPALLLTFNEQINPITSGSFSFYDVGTSGVASSSVNGAALSWAADYKSVQVTYPGPLNPGSRYNFVLNSVCNLAAYCVSSPSTYFYTSSSTDNTPETIVSVSVPDQATGVPLNPSITLRLSKAAAPGSITNSSVTLSPAPASGTDTVSLSSDGMTLTLSLGGNLVATTQYTISAAGGSFTDIDGNPVSAFTSKFTTGTSAEDTGVHGTISMTSPAPGASGIAITSAVTLTFSQPYNPNSVTPASFELFANNQNAQQIAGTISMPTSNTLVFTPAVALPPNVPINVYAGYNANITDYAGVTFQSLTGGSNAVFTTANTADNTPPQVISMSPGANATNVGPYATVSLTFSKSLSVSTINSSNFALYQGSTQLSPGISYSSDHRTVNLSTTLPYDATIEVAVNTSVQDYAGNNMASPYQASFTTLAAPVANGPSEIQSRPGSNAGLNVPVTIFMNGPMNLASVQAGLSVAQNGALIPGNVTLTADSHGIIWTPSSPYAPGALIEVYLTSIATDTSGNPAAPYKFSFTTQAQSSPPTEVSVYPGRNTQVSITNPVVEVQFSEPLDPATVTSSTFIVSTGSSAGGAVIPGTLSLMSGNTVARFTAAGPFPANQYFHISLTTGIKDMSANAFAGDSYYVLISNSATLDNTPPTLTSITPVNASTSIGDNAPIRLVFSKIMDTLSINPSTVLLLNGATQLPWTATFSTLNNPSRTVATLVPEAPLPDGAVINVHLTTGVNDLTGAMLADQTSTFTTMSGADFSAPYVVERSISNGGNSNVPTSATFTWVFNKPLDPTTVIGNPNGGSPGYFYIYDSAGCNSGQCYPAVNLNVSSDGRTVTMIPVANLTPNGTNDYFYANNATDLNGNTQTNTQQQFFTAATATVSGPTIIGTNPASNNSNPVPTNTSIEVIFSKPVSQISLGNITLTGGANAPYSVIFDNTYYTDDSVIRIVPQSLLLPNTTYTVNVTGVTDVAGNPAGTTTFTFTTGSNFQSAGVYLTGATVTTGPSTVVPMPVNTTVPSVLDNPTFTLTFDHQVDPASLGKWDSITLRDTSNNKVTGVTLNFQLSSDQKTVTITTSGLAAATTYRLWVAYGVYPPLDISGNYYALNSGQSGSAELPFTTQ